MNLRQCPKTWFLILVLVSLPALAFGADDWAMFSHDAYRSGYSTSSMPHPDSLVKIWGYSPGVSLHSIEIFSSPVVADSLLYYVSRDKYLRCLDAYTGEFQWKYKIGDEWYMGPPKWDPSPCVADDKVFVGSRDGKVYALSAYEDSLCWSRDLTFGQGRSPSDHRCTGMERS